MSSYSLTSDGGVALLVTTQVRTSIDRTAPGTLLFKLRVPAAGPGGPKPIKLTTTWRGMNGKAAESKNVLPVGDVDAPIGLRKAVAIVGYVDVQVRLQPWHPLSLFTLVSTAGEV
jgi:hypothetical protein